MTYTTVFKDYEAPTFAEAAERMLLDEEVWHRTQSPLVEQLLGPSDDGLAGGNKGYAVESWDWAPGRLRVWFR